MCAQWVPDGYPRVLYGCAIYAHMPAACPIGVPSVRPMRVQRVPRECPTGAQWVPSGCRMCAE
eukprot:2853653-Karenia_brevis.AAC.1